MSTPLSLNPEGSCASPTVVRLAPGGGQCSVGQAPTLLRTLGEDESICDFTTARTHWRRPAQRPQASGGRGRYRYCKEPGLSVPRVAASAGLCLWFAKHLWEDKSPDPTRQSEGLPGQNSQGTSTPGCESQHTAMTFFPHPDSVAITMTPTQWTQVATATVPMQWIQGG